MSPENALDIVSKVWNFAHVLRDDGVSYGDYLEQVTFLLFLKMMSERHESLEVESSIVQQYDWSQLVERDGDALENQYRHTLEALGTSPGVLGTIYRKAQNKIQNPALLKRLVSMMDEEEWTLHPDVNSEIYEGLLERNAADVKGGAGQYFTPRALTRAIVDVMKPYPGSTICDPACGTGGFLLAAHDYIVEHHPHMDRDAKRFLKYGALHGLDIVDGVVRMCTMNLFLHGIGGDEGPIRQADALQARHGEYDIVLANPPFGKKSSVTIIGEDGSRQQEKLTYERDDFWATTSNKQLNFLQHIRSILKTNGSAAVVLPDNVLFEVGAGETIRRKLLETCDVHTLLRLPTGIFYAQGVKANVLFFEKKPASEAPWTRELWIYDYRTNVHHTLKQNPLKRSDLDDFVACYKPGERGLREETKRFKRFTYEELVARDKANLDIFWLRDESLEDSQNLPPPDVLGAEIVESLEAALEEFRAVADELALAADSTSREHA